MSGLPLGTLVPNLKSVALTVFELLAFIAKKFRSSRDPGHAPFWKNFWGPCTLGTLVPNLKFVALIVFELLAFNAEKFRGSRDPGHVPFGKIFGGHVWTAPGNTSVKFQVRSFKR